MGRVPHRPLPVGIEQIVPEEPGRRATSAACHLRHPPDEVHDVIHEVVGGDIVRQDRGVVAGAPPIFPPAHLHVAFAILLHDCEGRRRKMPAWGRCHQPVGAGGVQHRHRDYVPPRRRGRGPHYPAELDFGHQLLQQGLPVLAGPGPRRPPPDVLPVGRGQLIQRRRVLIPAVLPVLPAGAAPHLAKHVEPIGEVRRDPGDVGVPHHAEELEEDRDLCRPVLIRRGVCAAHWRRALGHPRLRLCRPFCHHLFDLSQHLAADPHHIVAPRGDELHNPLDRRLQLRAPGDRAMGQPERLPPVFVRVILWEVQPGRQAGWGAHVQGSSAELGRHPRHRGSAGCATVSAMSMARRRRATPQCQPLATNRCLERSSPSPRSV